MPDRRALKRRFGLSSGTLRYLERAGYLKPIIRSAQYDFRDLLLLRTLGALRAAKLPTRTIHRALKHLQPWLTEERPLSRMALQASDDTVAVREGASFWDPGSGQYALPLEVNPMESQILPMTNRSPPLKPIDTVPPHKADRYRPRPLPKRRES
jgi:hypothetical protein